MAFSSDPLSSPETFYYALNTIYIGDEDDLDFLELESLLGEAAYNLDRNPVHAGASREFSLTLDNFDENSVHKDAEVLASFVVRLWEDDETELNLIIQSITEELENVGMMAESIRFLGTGNR